MGKENRVEQSFQRSGSKRSMEGQRYVQQAKRVFGSVTMKASETHHPVCVLPATVTREGAAQRTQGRGLSERTTSPTQHQQSVKGKHPVSTSQRWKPVRVMTHSAFAQLIKC